VSRDGNSPADGDGVMTAEQRALTNRIHGLRREAGQLRDLMEMHPYSPQRKLWMDRLEAMTLEGENIHREFGVLKLVGDGLHGGVSPNESADLIIANVTSNVMLESAVKQDYLVYATQAPLYPPAGAEDSYFWIQLKESTDEPSDVRASLSLAPEAWQDSEGLVDLSRVQRAVKEYSENALSVSLFIPHGSARQPIFAREYGIVVLTQKIVRDVESVEAISINDGITSDMDKEQRDAKRKENEKSPYFHGVPLLRVETPPENGRIIQKICCKRPGHQKAGVGHP